MLKGITSDSPAGKSGACSSGRSEVTVHHPKLHLTELKFNVDLIEVAFYYLKNFFRISTSNTFYKSVYINTVLIIFIIANSNLNFSILRYIS